MTNSEIWLKKEPKYRIGQKVVVTIKTTHEKTKLTFENDIDAYIVSILADGTDRDYVFTYGVVQELPAPYSYAKNHLGVIAEDKIVIAL